MFAYFFAGVAIVALVAYWMGVKNWSPVVALCVLLLASSARGQTESYAYMAGSGVGPFMGVPINAGWRFFNCVLHDFGEYQVGRAQIVTGAGSGTHVGWVTVKLHRSTGGLTWVEVGDSGPIYPYLSGGNFGETRYILADPEPNVVVTSSNMDDHAHVVLNGTGSGTWGWISVFGVGSGWASASTTQPTEVPPPLEPYEGNWISDTVDEMVSEAEVDDRVDLFGSAPMDLLNTTVTGSTAVTEVSSAATYLGEFTNLVIPTTGGGPFGGATPLIGGVVMQELGGVSGLLGSMVAGVAVWQDEFPALFTTIKVICTGVLVWNCLLSLLGGLWWAFGWSRDDPLNWLRLEFWPRAVVAVDDHEAVQRVEARRVGAPLGNGRHSMVDGEVVS